MGKIVTDSLLKKHGLEDANSVSTPLDPNIKFDLDPNELNNPKIKRESSEQVSASYAMLIRSLMYLAIGTQPDIAYSVQCLAQFMWNPRPIHWTAIKRIFLVFKSPVRSFGSYKTGLNQSIYYLL